MAALIEGENVKICHEGRCNEVPPMSVRRTAVNEKHGRLSLATMVKAIEDQSVDSKTKFLHLVLRWFVTTKASPEYQCPCGSAFATRSVRVTI
jgi:hypothetical protein